MAVSKGRLINTASGVVGGYAPLDSGLLIPASYLPVVPVANGGTAASTAAVARANLGIAGVVGGVEWTSIIKVADESVASSTTLQADDELLFATVSAGVYEFCALIVYASPAGAGTPDMKITIAEDATIRSIHMNVGLDNGDFGAGAACGSSTGFSSARGTAATNRGCQLWGAYVGGGGTAAIYWAQNTSGVNATIVRAGSILRYRRLA